MTHIHVTPGVLPAALCANPTVDMAQQLRHAMLREASAVQAHARGGDESFSGIVKDASHHHGKVPLSTGAWYLTDEYVAKAISKCPEATVREEGVQACTYKLDVGLAACLSVFFTGATVTELGAGVGRYTRFLQASGRTRGVVAYDGMPDVENKSRGIVHWADLSEPRLLLAPGVIHGARDGAAANPQPAIPHPEAPRPKGCLGSSWPRTARIQSDRHRLASTWVMSLEVAEHIPRRFEASFMRNVDCANTRGAVISWSSITQRQVHNTARFPRATHAHGR